MLREIMSPGFHLFPQRTASFAEDAAMFDDPALNATFLLLPLPRLPDEPERPSAYRQRDSPQWDPDSLTFTSVWDRWTLHEWPGRPLECRVPTVSPVDVAAPTDVSQSPDLSTVPQLLESALRDRCFYRQQGWWTFEFCYRRHVRHFHWERRRVPAERIEALKREVEEARARGGLVEGLDGAATRLRFVMSLDLLHGVSGEFPYDIVLEHDVTMGVYDPALDVYVTVPVSNRSAGKEHHGESPATTLREPALGVDVAGNPVWRELYAANGTPCDVSAVPRQTLVTYKCSRDGRHVGHFSAAAVRTGYLEAVREPQTCLYEVVLATEALCAHPAFRDRRKRLLPIVCQEVKAARADEHGQSAAEDVRAGDQAAAGPGSSSSLPPTRSPPARRRHRQSVWV